MEVAYDDNVPDFQFTWGEHDPIEDDDEPNDNDENDDDDTDGPEPPDEPEQQLLRETEPVDENPLEEGAHGAQEEGAHGAHNVGAFDAQKEGGALDTLDGAFDALDVAVAVNAQEVGAFHALEEGAIDAQEEGAHGAEERHETELVDSLDTEETQIPQHFNLRGNKIDYAYKFAFTQLSDTKAKGPTSNVAMDLRNHVAATGFCFNQMGMKSGVKKYGQRAIEAVMGECTQLDKKGVFKPVDMKTFTPKQLKRVLRAITLVTEKRSGKIKGRTVVDGRGQREYIDPDETTSQQYVQSRY
jgi:hypothetical protein